MAVLVDRCTARPQAVRAAEEGVSSAHEWFGRRCAGQRRVLDQHLSADGSHAAGAAAPPARGNAMTWGALEARPLQPATRRLGRLSLRAAAAAMTVVRVGTRPDGGRCGHESYDGVVAAVRGRERVAEPHA